MKIDSIFGLLSLVKRSPLEVARIVASGYYEATEVLPRHRQNDRARSFAAMVVGIANGVQLGEDSRGNPVYRGRLSQWLSGGRRDDLTSSFYRRLYASQQAPMRTTAPSIIADAIAKSLLNMVSLSSVGDLYSSMQESIGHADELGTKLLRSAAFAKAVFVRVGRQLGHGRSPMAIETDVLWPDGCAWMEDDDAMLDAAVRGAVDAILAAYDRRSRLWEEEQSFTALPAPVRDRARDLRADAQVRLGRIADERHYHAPHESVGSDDLRRDTQCLLADAAILAAILEIDVHMTGSDDGDESKSIESLARLLCAGMRDGTHNSVSCELVWAEKLCDAAAIAPSRADLDPAAFVKNEAGQPQG